MKKKEDARLAVLREYDRWAKDRPNDAKKMGGFVFFGYLEKERPDLLDFRAVGSKWQTVHGWLRHGGRLKDERSTACDAQRSSLMFGVATMREH
jgi:hypothetical protein